MVLSEPQRREFERDGFVIVPGFLEGSEIRALRDRFESLFRGEFQTGLYPDEWNWREGRDPPDLTRQICNAWKSDRVIAQTVLSEVVGRCCAQLRGWPGARINQDNVLWKPPGAKTLSFHQDESYQAWIVPSEFVTCWMALDDTTEEGGTIEYVRGSHRWALAPKPRAFHAPEHYDAEMRLAAARESAEPDVVRVIVKAGDCVFHHGRTWHGSGHNLSDVPRRAVVSHCMSSEAQFHPTEQSYIYSRYRKVGSLDLDESFFPILWTETGGRSKHLPGYLSGLPYGA